MQALLDATDSQMATLADLTASLRAAEQTLSSMLAARDGLLALAARLAIDIAQQGDHADKGEMTTRAVAAEIGAAQRVGDRTIERRMSDAVWLIDRFPQVWQAQADGRITAGHVRVIVDAAAHLEDAAQRAAYTAEVLPIAEAESPNRLGRLARRLAERFQRRTVDERHQDARQHRHVRMRNCDDAMAELTLHAPAVLIHGIFDRVSEMAHRVCEANADARSAATGTGEMECARGAAFGLSDEHSSAGSTGDRATDDRTVAQLRADLVAELLLTAVPTAHDGPDALLAHVSAQVEVTVPVLTLMDADGDAVDGAPLPPAELDGSCPIDIETARALAGAASGWERVLTHPISGALLAVDRYRPSQHLKRHLRARDRRCRFPGCGIAARKSDLDHTRAAAHGGETSVDNLAAFCRRHHMLKHHSPWHVRQLGGGLIEWTSPAGNVYLDDPPPQNTVSLENTVPFGDRAPF